MKTIVTLCRSLLMGTGLCLLFIPANPVIASAQASRLLSAMTTYNETGVWEATYYFTFTVPTSAAKPLQQVAFKQIQGLETINFDGTNSLAFEGTRDRRGAKLGITLSKSDRQPETAIVTFAQPLAPGQTVTIGLKPLRNPTYEGVYQFQVQSLATGEQTNNQIIGTARLQFYASNDSE